MRRAPVSAFSVSYAVRCSSSSCSIAASTPRASSASCMLSRSSSSASSRLRRAASVSRRTAVCCFRFCTSFARSWSRLSVSRPAWEARSNFRSRASIFSIRARAALACDPSSLNLPSASITSGSSVARRCMKAAISRSICSRARSASKVSLAVNCSSIALPFFESGRFVSLEPRKDQSETSLLRFRKPCPDTHLLPQELPLLRLVGHLHLTPDLP